MATRCVICANRLDGGRPQVNFIHYDGYPDNNGVGERLLRHYSTPGAVEELVGLGDLVALGNTPGECERREPAGSRLFPAERHGGEPLGTTLLRAVEHAFDVEWAYLFDGERWECMAGPARAAEWRGVPVDETVRRLKIWDRFPFDRFETLEAGKVPDAVEGLRATAADTGELDNPWWFRHAVGLAAYGNNREGLKALLDMAAEFDPVAKGADRRLASHALCWAVESPRSEEATVQLLLDAGADPNASRGKGRPSVLHRALDWGYMLKEGVVLRLVEAGADAAAPDDWKARTALERMLHLDGKGLEDRQTPINLKEAITAAERQVGRQTESDLPSPAPS